MMPLTIDKQEAILFAIRFMLSSDPMGQYQKRADVVQVLEGMLLMPSIGANSRDDCSDTDRVECPRTAPKSFEPIITPGPCQCACHGAHRTPRDLPDEDGLGPENNPEPKVRFQVSPTKPMRGPIIDDLSRKGILSPSKPFDAREHLKLYLRAGMDPAEMKYFLAMHWGIHWEEETILRCLAGLTA